MAATSPPAVPEEGEGGRRIRSILFSKFTLVTILLVIASAGAVYAGTRLDDGSAERTDTVRPDGSLTSQPEPTSLEDVSDTPAGSPARAVMMLWYWAQWGSSPNIVAAYHPVVVRRLGSADIAGAYASLRSSLVNARPRIVDVVRGREGTAVVTLEALRVNSPPQADSFTLKRVGNEWFVIFDTLLESGIAAYVQFRKTPDPDSENIPRHAKQSGLAAARAYRVAFLCRGGDAGEVPPGTPPIEGSPDC